MPERRLVSAASVYADGAVARARGVLIEGTSIVALLRDEGLSSGPRGAAVDDYPGATVLPGLVDAHLHICLRGGEDLRRPVDEDLVRQDTENGRAVASRLLRAGVTSARDLGCRGDSAQRVRNGLSSVELSLMASGRPITTPGGHFSSFGLAVSGPDDARRAVDRVVADGADLVKVMATGGILTPGTAPGRAQFTLGVLRALTDEAHGLGRRVATHAHGTEGIALAVDAGVDTIEHCTWLNLDGSPGPADPRLVRRIAEGGQAVVIAGPLPYSFVPDGAPSGEIPAGDRTRAERLSRLWREMARLREAGVRVALGTDSFFGQVPDHRDLHYRAAALVRHGGWNAASVLDLLTEGGAAALGQIGKIGRLAPAATADLVVVDGDPSADISSLQRVLAVYRNGRRVFTARPDDIPGAHPVPPRG